MTPILSCLLLTLAGFILFFLFGNVEKGIKRRVLQNFVYRGYQALKWVWAVWRAVDRGVLTYYEEMDEVLIEPLSEAVYKPVKAEIPEEAAVPEMPKLPGVSAADFVEGCRRFGRRGFRIGDLK